MSDLNFYGLLEEIEPKHALSNLRIVFSLSACNMYCTRQAKRFDNYLCKIVAKLNLFHGLNVYDIWGALIFGRNRVQEISGYSPSI